MNKLLIIFAVLIYTNIYPQIGTHTSREIDSLIITEGGPLSLMSIKSEERQKEWQTLNRNFFSSEIDLQICSFLPISVQTENINFGTSTFLQDFDLNFHMLRHFH